MSHSKTYVPGNYCPWSWFRQKNIESVLEMLKSKILRNCRWKLKLSALHPRGVPKALTLT